MQGSVNVQQTPVMTATETNDSQGELHGKSDEEQRWDEQGTRTTKESVSNIDKIETGNELKAWPEPADDGPPKLLKDRRARKKTVETERAKEMNGKLKKEEDLLDHPNYFQGINPEEETNAKYHALKATTYEREKKVC